MKLFAGIDGGQSSTLAVIADEHKKILGRGSSGPCDHVGQAADSPRFARALEDAISTALLDAHLPADSEFEAIVAGISGYEGAIHGLAPRLRSRRVSYVHDARIAHAGAFELRDGIVVIAGTGSVAYGRVKDRDAMVGGWGYLFGDRGSAFSIAEKTLAFAMQLEDEGHSSFAKEPALRYFKRSSLREIARGVYTVEIDRPALASFATVLLEFAETGGKEEQYVPYMEAWWLAELVRFCALRLQLNDEPIEVALAGGLFASAWYYARVEEHIRKSAPAARVVSSHTDPAGGALLLAYKEGAET